MDNFLEQFKDNLENQSPPDFDARDWADMQSRLDRQQLSPQARPNYLAWATAAVLLFLMGSNWFVFKELKKTNQIVNQLLISKDTIVQTKTIYKTDTVYLDRTSNTSIRPSKEKNKQERIAGQSSLSPASTATPSFPSLNNEPESSYFSSSRNPSLSKNQISLAENNTGTTIPNTQIQTQTQEQTQGQKQTQTQTQGQKQEQIKAQAQKYEQEERQKLEMLLSEAVSVPLLAALPLTVINDPGLHLPLLSSDNVIAVKRRKNWRQVLYPMTPKGIEVGLFMGGAVISPEKYKRLYTIETGFGANVVFADSWRLWASANFTQLVYESKKMGEEYGIPEIPFPKDDLRLEEAKVNREIWSTDVGLQYNFRTRKKIQPFLGLGYGISTMDENKVSYFFEDVLTEEQFPIEDQSFDNVKQLEFALLKTGVQYHWGKWRIGLDGIYRHRAFPKEPQVPSDFSSRLNVFYQF